MAGSCQLRLASSADLPALAALEVAAFSDPWSQAQLRDALAWPGVVATVAADGLVLIGYVLARVIVDEAEILSLATIPSRRREGVARQLLEAALQRIADRGAHAVWLEVRESNLAAQSLYRRYGFVAAGRRRDYYRNPGEDALVLRSEVEAALRGPATP